MQFLSQRLGPFVQGGERRQLNDPKQNGGKTLAQLLHHVSEDKLVLWGWNPGNGRTKPPLTHADFARKFGEWIDKGAAVPDK